MRVQAPRSGSFRRRIREWLAEEPDGGGGDARPILVPMIDFGSPTGDAMVEVRKGFGLSEVGASTPSP